MDERVYIAKLNGLWGADDIENVKYALENQLGGTVVVIDGRFDYVAQLEPQDASELVQVLVDYVNGAVRVSEEAE